MNVIKPKYCAPVCIYSPIFRKGSYLIDNLILNSQEHKKPVAGFEIRFTIHSAASAGMIRAVGAFRLALTTNSHPAIAPRIAAAQFMIAANHRDRIRDPSGLGADRESTQDHADSASC
jgi:hypothetical protein